jgi:Fic family protein
MAIKNDVDLTNFDFGFSIVDEQELDVVQKVQKQVDDTTSTSQQWQAQAEEWREKAEAIYEAVQPLLNNLASNPTKEYIYWPDRNAKLDMFKLRLQQILND